MIYASIDYSMTSPAICIYQQKKPLTFDACHFFVYNAKIGDLRKKNIIIMKQLPYQSDMERFSNISDWAIGILTRYKVNFVGLEDYAFASKSNRLFQIGENGGILKYKMWLNKFEYVTYAPTQIKKDYSGKGNANKEFMHDALHQKESVSVQSILNAKSVDSPVSDIVDSYAIMQTLVNAY